MNGHITQCNISESSLRSTFAADFDLVSCLGDFLSFRVYDFDTRCK
jgi:hypothetical protein